MNRYYIAGILLVGGLSSLYLSSDFIQNRLLSAARNNSLLNDTQQSGDSTLRTRQTSPNQSQNTENAWAAAIAKRLTILLEQGQFDAAIEVIESSYTQASVLELNQFKQLVANYAGTMAQTNQHSAALALLGAYCEKYDDSDICTQFAQLAEGRENWSLALSAYSRATSLEHRPDALNRVMLGLIRVASNIRAELERRGDQLGILAHYQGLSESHPNNTRFMLEVAQSHLRLGDSQSARQYLELLQYDVEFGALAQQKLADINTKIESTRKSQELAERKLNETTQTEGSPADIVIPLVKSGNSFNINVLVNSKNIRMLLDTGASITALSSNVIRRLNPTDMGQTIQLQTANGSIDAKLYRVKNLHLGRLRFSNVVVAEIDLPLRSPVQGLLGTDVLSQLNNRYSYVIDNQRNALIFKER